MNQLRYVTKAKFWLRSYSTYFTRLLDYSMLNKLQMTNVTEVFEIPT